MIKSIEKKFRQLFNNKPIIFQSPGRVNLIGEHTDYNMGFVLPAAINKAIYLAILPRQDNKVHLYAYDLNESFEFCISELIPSPKRWPNYLMGVVDQLQKAGYHMEGFNCVFGGNIPIGAGLSSSAALEAGLGFALNNIFNLGIDKLTIVKLAQKAENEFVGVKCGIMDQFINIFGESNRVLKIDCRSLEYEYVPFDFKNVSIVLFDTRVSHSLASSEYNQRRKECNEGVDIIKKDHPSIQSLRDVSPVLLGLYKGLMNETIYKRCKYVVEENKRLLDGCDFLKAGDLKQFGSLMFLTHEGLSKEYEVSCKELDFLVDSVKNNDTVYGSRMMGGGFGGCTINLVKSTGVDNLTSLISKAYKEKFHCEMKYYVTTIGKGTGIISESEYEAI